MSSLFDRLVQRPDNILAIEIELAVFVYPSLKIFAQRKSGHSHVIPVNQILLQKEVQNL